jgi:hypothetical protein
MRRSPLLAARYSFVRIGLATLVACGVSSFVSALAFAQAAKPAAPGQTGQGGKGKPAVAEAPKAPLPPLVSPPPPPPWTSPAPPSTNTSGATLLPESDAVPTPARAAPQGAMSEDERTSLEARLRMIEARLAADENALVNNPELAWLRRFHVSGFIQPQLLIQSYNTAASPNLINGSLPAGVSANDAIAKSNGTTTNGDFFRLRRARLKTEFAPSEGTRLVFEFDPTPAGGQIGGTGTIARTVEARGIAHWSDFVTTEFAAGVFKLPFGREILQSDADRPSSSGAGASKTSSPASSTPARARTRPGTKTTGRSSPRRRS